MDDDTRTALRVQLEEERTTLRERLGVLGGEGGDGPAFDEGFADSAQVAAEQGENREMVSQLQDTLQDVERALAKLDDDGAFGVCERCGEPIAEDRLEAMPASRWCMDCATRS